MIGTRSIRGRMMGWVLSVTGLILFAVIYWSYDTARARVKSDMEAKAVSLTDSAAVRIDAKLGVFQGVINGIALTLEAQRFELPFASMRDMQVKCMERNKEVLGVCVAFDPGMQPPNWPDLAAWEYRTTNGLEYVDLSGPEFAHIREDWFSLPKYLDRPVWSDPYKWEGIIMVTYSAPFYRQEAGKKRFAGVVTCDLSLDWLDKTISALPLGRGGYGLLMNRNGLYIYHPNHDLVLNETVYSMAENRHEPSLREIGHRMTSGKPGIEKSFIGFATGDLSWLAYTPLSTTDWIIAALISQDEMEAAILSLSRQQATLGICGMLLLWVAIWLIARSITRPISRLRDAADTLAGGDLEAVLPNPKGRDEVAGLTRSFGMMRENLKRYIEDLRETTATREKMQSELRIAHDIQMGLVPKTFPPFPSRPDIDLHAVIEPAREVGGDFYDFFQMEDEDRIVIAIGDVSGKGVPAALFMAVTRSFLRAAFHAESDPAIVLNHVSDQLADGNDACMFVTLFCAVYRFSDGTLRYANAGHNAPIIRHADGTLTWIAEPHGALAGFRSGMSYTAGETTLRKGDLLLLYTDGVTEAMNVEEELYGDERLGKRLSDPSGFPDCQSVTDAMLESIRSFAKGAEQSDDITMLALQRNGREPDADETDTGLQLSLANQIDDMQRGMDALDAFLEERAVSPTLIYKARLALEELVTNIIKYGYDDTQEHRISVSFHLKPAAVMLITDNGHAFDPLRDAPDPDVNLPLEERPIGGLGLHMRKEMGLTLNYSRRDDRNIMRIHFPA